MQNPETKVRISFRGEINLGDFNRAELEIEVEDWKRDEDKTVASAIDRVYDLVSSKVSEKLKEFK